MDAHLLRRVVGGAVVDDDDLQIRIVAGEDVAHRAGDDLPFVVGGNEHSLERRRLRQLRRHAAALGAPVAEAGGG